MTHIYEKQICKMQRWYREFRALSGIKRLSSVIEEYIDCDVFDKYTRLACNKGKLKEIDKCINMIKRGGVETPSSKKFLLSLMLIKYPEILIGVIDDNDEQIINISNILINTIMNKTNIKAVRRIFTLYSIMIDRWLIYDKKRQIKQLSEDVESAEKVVGLIQVSKKYTQEEKKGVMGEMQQYIDNQKKTYKMISGCNYDDIRNVVVYNLSKCYWETYTWKHFINDVAEIIKILSGLYDDIEFVQRIDIEFVSGLVNKNIVNPNTIVNMLNMIDEQICKLQSREVDAVDKKEYTDEVSQFIKLNNMSKNTDAKVGNIANIVKHFYNRVNVIINWILDKRICPK